jgi:hypothetical protein
MPDALPVGAFSSWREAEWTTCFQTCINDRFKQKQDCERARMQTEVLAQRPTRPIP